MLTGKKTFSLFVCLAMLVGPAATKLCAEERSSAARNAFLKSKGHCRKGKGCHVPKGYQVEHTWPLWAGGADHPSNMTLMKVRRHKRKSAAESAVRAEWQRTGRIDFSKLPKWKEGRQGGKVVRHSADGSTLVAVRFRITDPEGLAGYTMQYVRVPPVGGQRFEEVDDPEKRYVFLRAKIPRRSRVFLVSRRPFSIDVSGTSSRGTAPRGASFRPFSLRASALFPAESPNSSIGEQLAAAGMMRYDEDGAKLLGKRLRRKLSKAARTARKKKVGLWAALDEHRRQEKLRKKRLAEEKKQRERDERRRRREERKRQAQYEREGETGGSYGGGSSYGGGGSGRVKVKEYYRRDGTRVRGHTRSLPRSGGSGGFKLPRL